MTNEFLVELEILFIIKIVYYYVDLSLKETY